MTHSPLRRTCCKDFNNVCIISGGGTSQENPVLKTSQHLYKTVCLAYVDANKRERVFLWEIMRNACGNKILFKTLSLPFASMYARHTVLYKCCHVFKTGFP